MMRSDTETKVSLLTERSLEMVDKTICICKMRISSWSAHFLAIVKSHCKLCILSEPFWSVRMQNCTQLQYMNEINKQEKFNNRKWNMLTLVKTPSFSGMLVGRSRSEMWCLNILRFKSISANMITSKHLWRMHIPIYLMPHEKLIQINVRLVILCKPYAYYYFLETLFTQS